MVVFTKLGVGVALALAACALAVADEGMKPVELGAGEAPVQSHLTGASPQVRAIEAKVRGMRSPATRASWGEVKKEESALKAPVALPKAPTSAAGAAARPTSNTAALHPTAAEQQAASAIEDKIKAMRKPVKKATWAEVQQEEAVSNVQAQIPVAKRAYQATQKTAAANAARHVSSAQLAKDLKFVHGLDAPKKTGTSASAPVSSPAQTLNAREQQVTAIETKVAATLPGNSARLGAAQSTSGWSKEPMPAGYPMPQGDMGEAKGKPAANAKPAAKPAPTASTAKALKATNEAVGEKKDTQKVAKTAAKAKQPTKPHKLSQQDLIRAHNKQLKAEGVKVPHLPKRFHEPKPAKQSIQQIKAHEAKVHAQWAAKPIEEVKRELVLAQKAAKKIPVEKKKP